MEDERRHDSSTLSAYLRVLRRRWWIVALCTVLVPAAAVFFSAQQPKQYESSAEVYVDKRNLAAAITGIEDTTLWVDEERAAETEAELALTPEVAQRVVAGGADPQLTPDDVLEMVSVTPKGNSDILTVAVTDTDPVRAQVLADAFATHFAAYRGELDTRAIANAQEKAQAKLQQLRGSGREGTALYEELEQQLQQLEQLQALSTSRIQVIRPAEEAWQVAPQPLRNGMLGLFLGLVLGVGLAFLVEALDTRVRHASDVGERLGLTLLARLPAPPKKLAKEDRLVMLAQPTGVQAEAFRMLRTNLEFALVDSDKATKTLLVTSAVEREGKSTTAANLAVALARSGKHVALVDLDLRRPYLERFFSLPTTPGITDVALGRAPLAEAVQRIDLATGHRGDGRAQPGNGRLESGTLDVLVSGPLPPDPGEFISTRRLGDILTVLREHYDAVVIDTPPLLRVGDALALSSRADGILLVARLNILRRPMLNELARLLGSSPAPVLGFAVTGAEQGRRDDAYGYGYAYAYEAERERARAEYERRDAAEAAAHEERV